MLVIQSINRIATDERIRGGRPAILGTSVTVADVAIVKIYHAQDADGIAQWFGLNLFQVYAALAYYYEHKDDIDADIHAQIRWAEKLKAYRAGSQDSLLPR
jgi:uncharacterized protein (DUF433 family)